MSEISEDNDNLFKYNEIWDQKYLAPELVLTNFNYKLLAEEHGFGLYTFPQYSPNLHVPFSGLSQCLKLFDACVNELIGTNGT